jgi:hypothetical protein
MDDNANVLLSRLFEGDNSTAVAVAFALGALFHVIALRKAELEPYTTTLLGTFALFFPAAVCEYSSIMDIPILTSLGRVSLVLTSFTSGLFTSLILYCAFFHPLRHIPGPFPARISKIYAMYLCAKNMRYHEELARLHDKYGDFVRTGPREVSIRSAAAVDVVRVKCWKGSWHDQVSNDDRVCSTSFTRDKALYRLRRKAWDRAFTQKGESEAYFPFEQAKKLITLSSNRPIPTQHRTQGGRRRRQALIRRA